MQTVQSGPLARRACCALILALALTSLPAHAADPLPVFHPNDLVLFQGDSITDGGRQRTGRDYNHIMGQCYAYIIAAQIGAEYPERNLTFENRGVSGNSVVDMAQRWQADTLDLKPNLLSILIGINDLMYRHVPADQFEQVYDKLLTETFTALPQVKIVLCEPFLLPVNRAPEAYKANRAALQAYQDAVERLARKYRLPVVRFQDAFDDACKKAPADHWSWDGVHPTYAGHGLMVREWLKTVNAFWKRG